MSSSSTTNTQYKNQLLTDKDIKVFEAKRSQYFKGSIAVCVVYGIVALFLIAIAILSDKGRIALSTDLKPFVITFVFGVVLIIIIMAWMLLTFKPKVVPKAGYDAQACPDYWDLRETPQDDLDDMVSERRFSAATKCVRNTDILGSGPDSKDISTGLDQEGINAFDTYLREVNQSSDKQVNCNTVYPMALGEIDEKEFPKEPNKLRCHMAKTCGFAWSSVCN